ncbi:DUF2218 domain-containing protein [uncultured Roseovarius sp.]|uniref:DUF2218 domain-containing protein n=1 Tax=uncultured Roseovarius sp. TaxID=293344 RepID=UPI00263249B0|nr:DUF2218 domain-containing protein [uncultured Roseovarius sp.]
MTSLIGYIETPNASKYLQQLCKHFGHKIDVEYDAHRGTAAFVFGEAIMTADEIGLTVRFELEDVRAEEPARHVIDRHLETFAFREKITAMTWQSVATA